MLCREMGGAVAPAKISGTMKDTVPFYLVDVFASRRLTGNPLSLVTDADDLVESQMRSIAREFNQSETTFLLRPTQAGAVCRLRSFTPTGAEVGGAGHNALGAWLWLAHAGRLTARGQNLAREIAGEVLPVEVSGGGAPVTVAMDQAPPQFGDTVDDRAELAASLGLDQHDLRGGERAQVVSTGAAHLLVPLRDRAAVDRSRPDGPRLAAVLAAVGGEGCYLYSLDPIDPEAVAYTRFFKPPMGIVEDPATGTAAGPLVASLVATGRAPEGITAVVEQGYALRRPSRIHVTVDRGRVRLSGSGLVVAQGRLAVWGDVARRAVTAPAPTSSREQISKGAADEGVRRRSNRRDGEAARAAASGRRPRGRGHDPQRVETGGDVGSRRPPGGG
jgi:trans-2,3-dihydro-3-hydroxyanthranilate isomerase